MSVRIVSRSSAFYCLIFLDFLLKVNAPHITQSCNKCLMICKASLQSKYKKTEHTLSAAYQKAFFFFFWLVLFFLYIVFEGKFFIWQTKWTLGQQLIVSIISLLDMHPLCFPIGQQGLRLFSLSTDPQGLGMAKKLTHLCYPGLWLSKAGPGMGQNLPLLLFSQSSRCIDYFDP